MAIKPIFFYLLAHIFTLLLFIFFLLGIIFSSYSFHLYSYFLPLVCTTTILPYINYHKYCFDFIYILLACVYILLRLRANSCNQKAQINTLFIFFLLLFILFFSIPFLPSFITFYASIYKFHSFIILNLYNFYIIIKKHKNVNLRTYLLYKINLARL